MTATATALTTAVPRRANVGAGPKLMALAAGFVMAIVDTTVINVAGADIQDRLDLSLSGLTWVVDGYTLTFASLLLLAGSLANRYGAKSVYLTGTTMFVVASMCCGLATSGTMLVVGRLIQGIGAAACMPSSLALLTSAFPDPKQRAKMVGLWSSIISTSAAIGPVIGGVLVGTLGWRSIFLLNLPIGLLGFFMTYRLIDAVPGRVFKPTLVGHALSIGCLASLCFVLIDGRTYGWTSAPIVTAFVFALVTAVLFLRQERTSADPILPGALFRRARFSALNGVSFLLNFGLFGVVFMFGLFIQNARGASPIMAGLQMLPLWGVFVVGNLIFTRISGRWGTRLPMIVSLAIAAVATITLTTISAQTPYWLIGTLIAISSVSIGVTVPAMTTSLMESAGKENANVAGSTLNATRQVGTLMGVAVTGVVLSAMSDWYDSAATSFLIAAACYLGASLLAWRFTRVAPTAAQAPRPAAATAS
jgi:MFS transporter, DHA2 family, methylenomycin A resistance protein